MTNWIICPVRNNLHLTQKAVKSFLAQDIGNVGVFLLADEDTWQWARSQEEVHYLHPRPSVAGSWNAGIRSAFWSRHPNDYVLVCNNDVELHPATYRLLVEDGGGFVTGVGVTPEQFTETCGHYSGHDLVGPDADPDKRRPHPDFSCFLIRRWVWEKVGPFDEAYKIGYVEDADYHLRMHRLGVEAYCLDIPFLHHASATIKGASDEEAQRIMRQADENRELFRSRHGCIPGSPEYEALFSPESFGSEASS